MHRQLFEYDAAVGHRFVPGLRARVSHERGGYLIRVNQAGFRSDREFEPARTSRKRILAFGDSFTAGDGVNNRERYTEVLESLLPNTEVYNFGMSGTGTDQQYLLFKQVAEEFEHELVLAGVLVENIRRVAARYRRYHTRGGEEVLFAKPYFELDDGTHDLVLRNVPVPKLPVNESDLPPNERGHVDRGGRLEWLRSGVKRFGPRVKERVQRLSRYQPLPEYNRSDGPAWRLMKAILQRWIAESEVPVVVVPIPLYQYVEGTASAKSYQARFAELSGPSHFHLIDPLPALLRYPAPTRRTFRSEQDCHLTPAGHRALAEALACSLEDLLNIK
jgi:carbamoyltransferase